jgi:hypothetical protein
METLYMRAIDHYNEFCEEEWIVPNSIPILYFGDLEAYRKSDFKIVTVGLNPSDREFEVDRFGLRSAGPLTTSTLEHALSDYFQNRPYSKWFDPAFETFLQPLGASFYGEQRPTPRNWWRRQANRALHTDICTPLATRPTWSGLEAGARERLQTDGMRIWRDLVAELEPDLILVSIATGYLVNSAALGKLAWRSLSPFPSATPRQKLKIAKLGGAKIVWGQASRRPFFFLGRGARLQAAEAILDPNSWE